MKIGAQWTKGWLAFETGGEKRRLAPYPPDWVGFTDGQLVDLCAQASEVRRRLT